MQRIRERLPYLFPPAATPLAGEPTTASWADVRAETAVTAVGFAGCAMLAAVARGDVPTGAVVAYLDRHLPDLRFAQQVGLQLMLLGEGSVRLDAIFSVEPPPAAAAAAFRRDYAIALRGLREWATPVGGAADEPAEVLDRLFAVLEPAFRPELLEVESRQGLAVGRLLHAEGEVPPQADAQPPGTYLREPERGGLVPLVPFVRCEGGEVQILCGLSAQGLRYLSPRRGTMATIAAPREVAALAEVLLRFGIYRKALALLRTLSEADGRVDDAGASVLHASHAQTGVDLLEAGRADRAAPELVEAVRRRPDLPAAVYLLARAYRAAGDRRRAVRAVQSLLDRAPHLDRGHELLADLRAELGDRDGARASYLDAAQANPYNRTAPAKRAKLEERRPGAAPPAPARPAPSEPVEKGGEKAGDKAERKLSEEMLVDMTAEARSGAYAPLVGRERELGQLVEILACQRKRHALVLGDPGVGKTALVEELARRMAAGNVPPHLKGRRLLLMSVATLLAGAKYRGQFEERVLDLIKEIREMNVVLFIDDFHTIVNAGLSRGGTLDTSNLLKPALVRGEIQTIGATSFDEYRANVEKDPSLARCYQLVRLEEPSTEVVAEILREVGARLQETHGVRFVPEALAETLDLVKLTIRERAMPDKAIDVMERAAAHASLREAGAGRVVTRDDLVQALASISGVPVEKVAGRTTERLWALQDELAARVVGQDHAVAAVARVVRAARLNLTLRAHRPDGVFLFVGPTGVGKTELARALADILFGDEERLIRIDMSEYMEKISGSRLIGSSPGYVGYNDQNQLTDLVRRNPCSLVLLDEVEKADAQMMNLFLQVFDAGRLTDGKGRTVHFSNTTIVMTSNVGSRLYARGPLGYGVEGDRVSRVKLMKEIRSVFPPEFLNRIDEIVFFRPLDRGAVKRIALLLLGEVRARLGREGRELCIADDVLEILADEGFDAEYGARQLARTIAARVLHPLAALAARVAPEEWRGYRRIALAATPSPASVPLPDAPPDLPVLHVTLDASEPLAEGADLIDAAVGEDEADGGLRA